MVNPGAKPRSWEVDLWKGSAFLGPWASQVLLDRTWKHFCSPLLPPHLHHWCQLHLLLCLALDLGLTKTFLYIVFIFSHCQVVLSELDLPVPNLEQSNTPRAQSKFLFSSNWCRGCRSRAFPLKHTWSCAQWLNTKLHSPSDCRTLFLPG